MLRISNYLKIVPKRHFNMPFLHRTLTSHDIRHQFLDYFIKSNNHTFIRSSPVVPYCDASLAFANSGMNQFNNVFLGKRSAPCLRGVNSQKCVRVDGKYNDLSIVGTDAYHHTFFEMLGNWSFGDYFKKEACDLAWNLLKGPYQIDTSRLYVTYFGGDESRQLPPDYECKDIWRALGISEDHILPFGLEKNFWAMGNTGPSGPVTEIYIDNLPNSESIIRTSQVNPGFFGLTKLWNVVFIEYILNEDGSVTSLTMKHIDSGMGMERLVGVLQGKTSNYETDLFRPIIDRIQKVTKAPNYVDCYDPHDPSYGINLAYRILADHTRLITACLADGMIPEQNEKLRQILHKSLSISSKTFRSKNLLHEIVPDVIEILGDTYPEMQRNFSQIQQIIRHEYDVFEYLSRSKASKLTKNLEENLRVDDSLEYARISGLQNFNQCSHRIDRGQYQVSSTDSVWKYSQEYNKTTKEFVVPIIKARIVAMENRGNETFDLILDKTNFYYESGGQASDIGHILHKNAVFDVENVHSTDNVVIHRGKFSDGKFEQNDVVELAVNGNQRTGNTRNHTATHLLQASVKKVTKGVVYQKSSCINSSGFELDLGILGYKHDLSSIKEIENLVRSIIQSSTQVTTIMTDSNGLYNLDDVTLVPGKLYPDSDLRILCIENEDYNFTSKEPCCGTHASNTAQLEDFCITNVKASGRSSFRFSAITGPIASQAHLNGRVILNDILKLKSDFDKQTFQCIDSYNSTIQRIRKILSQNGEFQMPHVIRAECLDIIDLISTPVKNMSRESLKDLIDLEMKSLLQDSPKESHPFIVHFLTCATLMESVQLQKATRFCTDRPIIVLSFTDGHIRARCCVPPNYVTPKFSATLWLHTVTEVFEAEIRPSFHGQNKDEVCHMTPKKLNSVIFDEKLEAAMEKAAYFARDNM